MLCYELQVEGEEEEEVVVVMVGVIFIDISTTQYAYRGVGEGVEEGEESLAITECAFSSPIQFKDEDEATDSLM